MDAIEKNTIPFLRMAAMEMRRIADDAPDIAERLRVMASKLDAEADDLATHRRKLLEATLSMQGVRP